MNHDRQECIDLIQSSYLLCFGKKSENSNKIRRYGSYIQPTMMMKSVQNEFPTSRQGSGYMQLEALIANALLDGQMKPGDRVAVPDELAQNLGIPLCDVIDSISAMLARNILRQDTNGNLFIHNSATPTVEMRQQAFVLRARQLMDTAKKWNLPSSSIEPLLYRATQQVA